MSQSGPGIAPAFDQLPPEAFLDLGSGRFFGDGSARCTALAICDETGRPARSFHQGQAAHFYFEFVALSRLERAAAGLEFADARGRVVHGRSGFQSGTAVELGPGERLRCHQVVTLDLDIGEYDVTVGLASADAASCDAFSARRMHYEVFVGHVSERARLQNAARLVVVLPPGGFLAFHGAAGLPGSASVETRPAAEEAAASALAPGLAPASAAVTSSEGAGPADEAPAIFHLTHWKAGSQWIRKILDACASDRIVPPALEQVQFLHWPIRQSAVYPTLYLTAEQFATVRLPASWRRFVVIRDLRDTLVSAYFSFRDVHPELDEGMVRLRAYLREADFAAGMLHLMDHWLHRSAAIQLSWLEAGERLIRYEDLLGSDTAILERVLIDECRMTVSRERLRATIMANRFERVTGGRPRGQEDLTAHERKGVAGDWRNHFDERLKKAFKARFGGALVATGYARDLDW